MSAAFPPRSNRAFLLGAATVRVNRRRTLGSPLPATAGLLALLALGLHAPAAAFEGAELPKEPETPKTPALTLPPELLGFVEAPYPEAAQKSGIEGEVQLLISIGADGRVTDARVAAGAGHGFDEAALAAVKAFTFRPAEIDEKPAAVQIEYVYRFVLKPAAPSPPAPAEVGPSGVPPVSLHGRVLERGSKQPVAGASVRCDGQDGVAVTEGDGRFELGARAGPCALKVISAAHLPFDSKETVREDAIREVTAFVTPVSYGLFETVIRDEREANEVVRRTLERQEIEKIPGTLGDPVRVIQNLPGVARAPFISGQLVVRGATPAETGTYLDGVEIPLLFHLLGGPSVLNPEFIERVDFYPGGFGPRYGRAVGGIVDVTTRRPETERVRAVLDVDLLDTSAFAAVPLGAGWSISGAARRSYIDVLLPLVAGRPSPDPRAQKIFVSPRYWDYQLRVDRAVRGSPHAFTAMVFGSDDALKLFATGGALLSDFRADGRTRFTRVRAAWSYRAEPFALEVAPYFGLDAADVVVQSTKLREDDLIGGVRADASYTTAGGHALRAGLDLAGRSSNYRVQIPPPPTWRTFPGAAPERAAEDLSRVIEQFDYGSYLELDVKLGRLRVLPGLRADAFRLRGSPRSSVDPRLTVRAAVAAGTTLKGSVGLYRQPPDAEDLDPLIGNPNLDLVSALQTSLGVEHQFTDVVNVDVVAFFNRSFDRVVGSSRVIPQPDGTYLPEHLANNGLGRAYGVEVLVRHEITPRFFGWLAYTLSRNEIRNRGQADYRPGSFDETHILTAVAQVKLGLGFELGSRFRLVTGRPQTPILDSVFDADRDAYAAMAGEPGSERARTFHQLDLRVDKTFLFDWWALTVYLELWNVYNAQNTEGVQWDYRFREKVEIPGLPLLPVFGLKGVY